MVQSYVALDLETTGLDPKHDKVIEIGAVKVIAGEIVDTFSEFVNPGRALSEKVKQLTGITEKDLEEAPYIEEVLPNLLHFMEELPILGHSVLFDYSFIKRAAVNQGESFEKEGIDTLKIARKYLSCLESRNLGYLCSYFHIQHQEHRALGDAMATHLLYLQLCNDYYEDNNVFKPQVFQYHVKKESPITRHQKERLYELINKHKLMVDYDVERLTRNEASRYTDRILSEYGR